MRALPVSHEPPAADAERAGILVGVDGSDGSLWALERAHAEAAAHGLPLHVLAAVNPTPAVNPPAGLEDVVQDSVARLLAGMSDVVQRAVSATLDRAAVPLAPSLHVVPGDPIALLLAASATHHTLILGTRGNGGFPHLLLGSVASALSFHSLCPVLLVPGPRA